MTGTAQTTGVRKIRHFTLERTLPRHVIVVALMVACCSRGLALQLQPMDVGLHGKSQHVNAVTHWNRIATEIFPIEPDPVIDSRAFAILHAAVLNGIERRYEPYTIDLSFPGASVDAAVGGAPDGPAKGAGLILGKQTARANLDRRSDDGRFPISERNH
jgi:hypothetical protein